MSHDWRISLPTGREQFHHVFHNGIFSDVKLIVCDTLECSEIDKQVILSHSLVLKIRSSVFEKLIEKVPITANYREITIQGYSIQDVKKFIQFLYTEELEHGSSQEVQKVLHLAKKYKVQGLVSKCTEYLGSVLSVENASSTFQTAKELNEIELERRALHFIVNNASEVVGKEDFLSLTQLNLFEILENDDLDVNEMLLFRSVLKWAKFQCTQYKIQDTPKHLRLILKEGLNLIRFPIMSWGEFLENVVPTGVLSDREVTEIQRYFDATPENRQFVLPASFSVKPRLCITQKNVFDLTKVDIETHKLLAKFAVKRSNGASSPKTLHVSNVIAEIEGNEATDLKRLQEDIFKIKKFGLFWGASEICDGKLLLSFAADDRRPYGVGAVLEEIQDTFQDVKVAFVKSYKDDLLIHL